MDPGEYTGQTGSWNGQPYDYQRKSELLRTNDKGDDSCDSKTAIQRRAADGRIAVYLHVSITILAQRWYDVTAHDVVAPAAPDSAHTVISASHDYCEIEFRDDNEQLPAIPARLVGAVAPRTGPDHVLRSLDVPRRRLTRECGQLLCRATPVPSWLSGECETTQPNEFWNGASLSSQ